MKSKWAIISIMIIVILGVFIGCEKKQSTKEKVYSDFQKKISTMSSYSCIAEIKAVGNKSEHNYVFIHSYNKPDNYKLEVISPKHLKGKTIEYKGDKILVKNPNINDVLELPNVGKNEQYMFIGDFIKNYLQNEEVSISLSDNKLVLETYIPGDNEYFNKQVLYVNCDTKTPEIMEILDNKENIKFVVTYKDFQWKK
ncbi:germination lipoprotein GerS [Romboutsia sp.]|uniref:germination lipoprotein GerS n=1 Tax=Romboutsia sp. TaxID=1965302 RepID=UPI003F31CAB2